MSTAEGRLLVVVHSRTGSTRQLTDAFLEGVELATQALAGDAELSTTVCDCLEADAAQVMDSQAVVVATPANFGYMSGLTKDFFERIYHPCLDTTVGLPYVLIVKGDTDTSGAVASVERIATGLGWRAFRPPLTVTGPITAADLAAAQELGSALAAAIGLGLT